jgi:uncharacterized repeat protein (TIGR02543 family)
MKQNVVFLAGVVCILLASCNNIFYTLASSGKEPDTGEYIVRFDKNGGDTEAYPQSIIVKAPGSTVMLPSIEPEREGYIFTGWNTEKDGSGAEFTKDTLVKANITVYAQWLDLPTGSCIVHFDKNNTDANSQEAYPQNKAVIPPSDTITGGLPAEPTRTGYDFTGWNTERDGTGVEFTADTPVSGNITVYAQWEPYKCVITFDKNHNDEEGTFTEADPQHITVSYPAERAGELPRPPTRDRNNFTMWNTKADGTGEEFIASTLVGILENKELTVYAQWAEKTYTISGTVKEVSALETNGYPVVDALLVVTQPGRPNQSAYTDDTGSYELDVYSGECHITVSCQSYVTKEESIDVSGDREMNFNLVLITYAVSGIVTLLDDGSGNVENVQLQLTGYGTYPSLNPQTNGSYNFPAVRVGSFTIYATLSGYEGDNKYFNVSNADVSNINLTLKKWWTVSFQSDKGNLIPDQTIAHGNMAERPATPNELGYNFVNWYSDPSLTTVYDFNTLVTGNITLYAKWETVTTYTVNYNANGATSGSAPSAQTVNAGDSIMLPGANGLAKTGYTFGGWNTNAAGDGANYTAGSTYTVNNDITFFAKWNEIQQIPQYTITFDINNGSGTTPAPQTANAGDSINLPDDSGFSRDGYTFGGWNTNAAGNGTNYNAGSFYEVDGTRTLYAKWTATGTNPSNPPSGIVIFSDNNTNYQDVLVQLYTVDWFSQELVPLGSPIKPDENGEFSLSHVTEAIYFITASLEGYSTAAEPVTPATQFPVILTLYPVTSGSSQSINLQQLLLQLNN